MLLRYNSAVFSELAVFSHNAVGVQLDFLIGAPFDHWASWNATTSSWEAVSASDLGSTSDRKEIEFLQKHVRSLEGLDNADCMRAYSKPLVTDRGDVLLVTNSTNSNSSVLFNFRYPH